MHDTTPPASGAATDPALPSVRHHPGFARLFPPTGELTLGVFFAIEAYPGAIPTMANQLALAGRADELGFAGLWVRDVPLHDPTFGDVGQVYDPWVYLGLLAGQAHRAALVTGGIVLPLRHPLDVAKAAASVDVLSGGRMVLGLSSGDRPIEYPAYGVSAAERIGRFQDGVRYLQQLHRPFPTLDSPLGNMVGAADLLPKPVAGRLPLLAVGRAGQELDWLARHTDAFVTYPRHPVVQARIVDAWNEAVARQQSDDPKPVAQSFYVDLLADPGAAPSPIHLGLRTGRRALVDHLGELHQLGVRHVALNLKYGRRPADEVVEEIGTEVLPAL